jgi:hypothetical protein
MRIANMLLWLMTAVPAFALPNKVGNWDRLGRLPRNQEVKVYLRDGRAIQGTIQRFGADGLGLVEAKRRTKVRFKQIESTVLFTEGAEPRRIEGRMDWQKGQALELKMCDCRILVGVAREMSVADELLWLAETGSGVRLGRADIVRVMSKRSGHRARNAAIGAAGGAAFYLALTKGYAPYGMAGAILGAIPGALIPTGGWTLVYQTEIRERKSSSSKRSQ